MTLGSNNKGGTLAAGRTNLFDRFVNPNEVIAYTYDMLVSFMALLCCQLVQFNANMFCVVARRATPSSCMLLVTGIKCARKEALDFLARAGNKVAVVVRNLPPEVPCIVCGETSSHVMPGVGGLDYAEEDDFFCVKHAPVRLAVRHAHLEWPCGAAGMVIPRVPAEGSSRLPQQSALRCMWVSDGRQPDHCQWIGRQSTRSGCCRASA